MTKVVSKHLSWIVFLSFLPMMFASANEINMKPGLQRGLETLERLEWLMEQAQEEDRLPDFATPEVKEVINNLWNSNAIFEKDRLSIYDVDVLIEIFIRAEKLRKRYSFAALGMWLSSDAENTSSICNDNIDTDAFIQDEADQVTNENIRKMLVEQQRQKGTTDLSNRQVNPEEESTSIALVTNGFPSVDTASDLSEVLSTLLEDEISIPSSVWDIGKTEETYALMTVQYHSLLKLFHIITTPCTEDKHSPCNLSDDQRMFRDRLRQRIGLMPAETVPMITGFMEEWKKRDYASLDLESPEGRFGMRVIDITSLNASEFILHLLYPEEKQAILDLAKTIREDVNPMFYLYLDRFINALQ